MAGHRYSVDGQTAAGSTLTILKIVSPGTTRRGWIYDLVIGSDATPADVATEFNLIRGTVSGTPTSSPTGRALDPGNPAAILLPEAGTFSGQTKTASTSLLNAAVNQRATYRHVFVEGGEIVIPAAADNWVGLESIGSGGTPNINATFHWME